LITGRGSAAPGGRAARAAKKAADAAAKAKALKKAEKKPASNNKIITVAQAIFEKFKKPVKTGYFVPCIREVPEEIKKKYPDINIYGVEWLMNTIKCDQFTVDEFFTFFEEVIGPILDEKIYG
jgi:phage terminase Nu1 subunit (DNA packaging protein)